MPRRGWWRHGVGGALTLAVTGAAAQTATTAIDPINASQLLQLVGGLVAVLLLIGALYFLRPLLLRLGGQRGAAGRVLSVIDAIHVGPRDRLVLVEVGGRRVLLGVSAGSIRPLLDVDAAPRDASAGFAGEMQTALRTVREQTP